MRPRLRVGWPAALGLALALAGCAHAPRVHPMAPPAFTGTPRVAFLPLANLSGRTEVGDVVSRVFFTALVHTGCCEVVDPGETERVVESLRIRDTGALTTEQARALADSLRVPYLITGTLLEHTNLRTPEGDVPTIGVALEMRDVAKGRVVWADARFRNGQDRETLFGWGRVTDAGKLATELATEMFEGLRRTPEAGGAQGGTP